MRTRIDDSLPLGRFCGERLGDAVVQDELRAYLVRAVGWDHHRLSPIGNPHGVVASVNGDFPDVAEVFAPQPFRNSCLAEDAGFDQAKTSSLVSTRRSEARFMAAVGFECFSLNAINCFIAG